MKTKVKIDDVITLLEWVGMYLIVENPLSRTFKYQNLLDQAVTYKMQDTPLDTRIHHLDELLVDVYRIYDKIVDVEQKVDLSEVYSRMTILPDPITGKNLDKKMLMSALDNFKTIFIDLMMNYEFEQTEIRGIQKNFLTSKLNELVENEQYEEAALLRDRLKTF